MEMTDAAFPLLKGVVATTNVVEACKDVNIAIMLGGYPWKEIKLRKDMLSTNVSPLLHQADIKLLYTIYNSRSFHQVERRVLEDKVNIMMRRLLKERMILLP
nr:malate dehydrogenase, cytoplasmic [Quercus suber]